MKNMTVKLLTLSLAILLATPAWGQDEGLESALREMVDQNAKGYLSPLATAFGTGLNSGTFHTARPHKILGFDFKFNVMATAIPDADLEYEFFLSDKKLDLGIPFQASNVPVQLSFSDVYTSGVMSQTFFGASEDTQIPVAAATAHSEIVSQVATATGASEADVETLAGTEITSIVNNIVPLNIPGGIGLSAWPTLMPQFSLGLPFSLEVTFRGFSVKTPDGDAIKFSGFGGKIGLNQFIPIPLFPIDLSAGWYGTTMNLADIIIAKNSILTFQVSKSIPVLTLYGGFGLENTTLSVDLKDDADNQILDFDLDGANSFRTTVGLRIKLLLLSVNAAYNTGEYVSYTLGIGLTLR